MSIVRRGLPKTFYLVVQLISQLLEVVELKMQKSRILLDRRPRFDRREFAGRNVEYLVRETIQAGQARCRQCRQAMQLVRGLRQILFRRWAGDHERVSRYFEVNVVVWYVFGVLEWRVGRDLGTVDEEWHVCSTGVFEAVAAVSVI